MTLNDWTEDDQRLAFREGWCISECFGSTYGNVQIQKVDDPEAWDQFAGEPCATLGSDADAWNIVMAGCMPHHEKARQIIREVCPQEWALIEERVLAQVNQKGLG